jgi:Bacterial SH3 domain
MLKRANVYMAMTLILLLSLTASATQATAQESDNDPGVDLAVVTAQTANLRLSPNSTSKVVRRLSKADILVVIDRTPVNGWYNVLDVSSNDEGWISQSLIYIRWTRKEGSVPRFEEQRTGGDESPRIDITNETDKTLSLRIGGNRYSVAPHSTRSISQTAGTYKFYASVPNVYPLVGEKTWENGTIYSWNFYIQTTYR